jgi:hypothetical protein
LGTRVCRDLGPIAAHQNLAAGERQVQRSGGCEFVKDAETFGGG